MLSILRKSFAPTIQVTKIIARRQHTDSRLKDITFEPLTEDRYDQVLHHLRTVSYHDVPLYKASGLLVNGKAPKELDNVYLYSMEEGISSVALYKGEFAGVLINGVLTPDAVPGAISKMKSSTNEIYKKMDYMFLRLLLDVDIFNRFGIDKAMECRLLSTTREFRGSGLGKILVDRMTYVARELNFPLILGEAVNEYLWKLLVAEGWIMLREMPYTDYIDEVTGKPLYNVKPPHHILGLCGRIVDNRCKCKDPLPLPKMKLVYPKKMD